MKYTCTINGHGYSIDVINERLIIVNGREVDVDFKRIADQPVYSLLMGGQSFDALVYSGDTGWEVQVRSHHYVVIIEDERSKRMHATAAGGGGSEPGEFHLKAPMPGLVVAVSVEQGQEIQKGQVLMILESMKMQNELKAPRGGIVGEVRVQPGETVEGRQVLLSIL